MVDMKKLCKIENPMKALKDKYNVLIKKLFQQGGYIWGTGLLGQFAYKQCNQSNIKVHGFIDNNSNKWSKEKDIYSSDILTEDDVVIVASFYYPEIMEQMECNGIKNYIYYEELAFLVENMRTYYTAFENIFSELEDNIEEYGKVYELLSDKQSKEIYENIIRFKSTLDIQYTKRAFELSCQEGVQDFDKLILEKLDKEYTFFDVGGYTGSSTLDYIRYNHEYNQIYFFEPDAFIIEQAKETLKDYKNIVFVQAGVGEKNEARQYCSLGNGGGFFSEDGTAQTEMVRLDDYVKNHKSYIKMDIEGSELEALKGAKKCIETYKPLLSISIYHLPGDIHTIIPMILSLNPGYKVYIRHYTNTYADTRAYFIDEEWV